MTDHGHDCNDATFPTGRTVPFPYAEPYPQQIDLMETILSALKQRQLQCTSTSTRTNLSKTEHTNTQTQSPTAAAAAAAAVLMLESPTGTGKSLSLACAALAWLRHMEATDLLPEEVKNDVVTPTPTATATATASTNDSKSITGLDWLDSWVPPEVREQQDRHCQARETAKENRLELTKTLADIQSKLVVAESTATACHTSRQKTPAEMEDRRRTRRENLVRTSITAVKVAERKQLRQTHKRRRVVPRYETETEPTTTPKRNSNNMNGQEFLLEDYRSDDNGGVDDDHGSGDDDDDDDDFTDTSPKDHMRRSRAAFLLDGAALDGSGSAGAHRNNKKGGTIIDGANQQHAYTVGKVQPGSGVRKIVYAARTHSQLSQFVGELKRTAWGSTVRVLALGGRKALCGNHDVRSKMEGDVNEACLDLQKGKTAVPTAGSRKKRSAATTAAATATGCPLLASREAIDTLALQMLAQPTDIEEAAALGNTAQTCAYYASRKALAAAEVVVLPYSMLLSKQTRDAIGLSLKESLVIVDEAHNLPEALRSLHSCRLTLPVILSALEQLGNYVAKYSDRLASRNLFYLGQIRKILLAFQRHLEHSNDNSNSKKPMMTPGELLVELKLDNVNLFKMLRYLEHSRLAQKLLGFTNRVLPERDGSTVGADPDISDGLSKHVSAMSVVQTFLEKLTFSGKEGKIVVDLPSGANVESRSRIQHPAFRYVLLHPAAFFENVLKESHALALVGGTLRPFVHVASELLGSHSEVLRDAAKADADMQKVVSVSCASISPTFTAFACDHVVSSSNTLLQCISKGPTDQVLDFRHRSRTTKGVCDELGRTLEKLCHSVPAGVVVFLPSYSYEAHLVRHWKQSGLWQDLQKVKKLHREPKSSQQVEAALQSYARDVPKGALLLSVIGGKMSEGINFSNDMARCVVVVGLPYPDITDPELKEKMTNMDQAVEKSITGQAYYQNLCMRAVNQSVGRAIRHANDYAAIVLLDQRYQSDSRIWSGLPSWLKKGAAQNCRQQIPFGTHQQELKQFFDGRK